MCDFLSAIYLQTGRLICEPQFTDSHSDLLRSHNIAERNTDAPVQTFVRLELTPPDACVDWSDLGKWREKVDEHEVPAWFDKAARFDAFEQMRDVIRAAMDDGLPALVMGRLVILRGDATREIRGCRAICLGNSTVTARDNSTVTAWDNSTVKAWGNSTVTAWGNSTVTAWDNSTVTAWDNSTVTAWDNSTVTARGNSTVTAWDNSTVKARDNSTVKEPHKGQGCCNTRIIDTRTPAAV